MTRGAAFDVQAVCSGFVFARLPTADNFIKAGAAKTDSRHRRRNDVAPDGLERPHDLRAVRRRRGRGGAAARAKARAMHPIAACSTPNFIPTDVCTICSMSTAVRRRRRRPAILRMQGKEVFKHAVTNTCAAIETSARMRRRRKSADIDWIVPHQANQRILDTTAKKLARTAGTVVSTIAQHGNTSAASVPLALAVAVADGRIKRGDLVLLEAMGGGFTWGAALIRW